MAHNHTEECDRLQEALANARARQSPPQRDTAAPGFQAPIVIDPANTSPDASPELKEEIANLEQQLRDMGCEAR